MYRGISLLPSSVIFRSRKTFKLLATLVITSSIICFWITGCGKSPLSEETSYPGTWVGYIELGSDKGTITLEISEDRSCAATGTISGRLTNWGNYTVDMEGSLTIGNNSRILGNVTVRRVCTMFDTTITTATISGSFDLRTASVTGTWATTEDASFMAGGQWGAMKQ